MQLRKNLQKSVCDRISGVKIAIDVSQIVYQTGVSTYTENLVKSLLKIDHKNQYLLFGTSLHHSGKFKKLKRELASSPNVSFKFFMFPIRFFEILFNKIRLFPVDKIIGEIDVLHTSDWIEPKVSSSKIHKITTIHDMVPYLFPMTLHKRILKNQLRRLKIVKVESAALITPSKIAREDTIKFLGIPGEKITVIPEAVSNVFKPQPEEKIIEVLKKFKIKKPFILTVGTQEPRKNIHKLIDAFENIAKERENVTLVLTGKYGWGQALEIVPNTIQTGFVTKEELICLYASCRVFVYPSLYEGFGLPVLEAMACGAPVITSNNSAMAEIAQDSAILVNPRNDMQIKRAIELVLDLNEDDYQKMIRASLDRARQFTWVKTAKETLKVYERVANI